MPVILFTSRNPASRGIADALASMHGFEPAGDGEWARGGVRMIETDAPTVLDVPTGFDTDYILVLSSHKSKNWGKMLTAHFPGNWGAADFGGEPKTLNIACASRLKTLMLELEKANSKLGWPLFIEADHHGPTCDVPIMFVEIGSTENEWGDKDAAAVVAEAVSESLKVDRKFEAVLGFGGGHYSRGFTKTVLETNLAVGHVAPKYALDAMDGGMFAQAVGKTVERVSRALVLRGETNVKQKEKLREMCEAAGVSYEEL